MGPSRLSLLRDAPQVTIYAGGASATAPALGSLASLIITRPDLAGENGRLLDTSRASLSGWPAQWSTQRLSVQGLVMLDGQHTTRSMMMDGQRRMAGAALHAERMWQQADLEIRSRAELMSSLWDLYSTSRGSELPVRPAPHAESFEDRAALPAVFSSSVPTLNALARGLRSIDDVLWPFRPAGADWSSLQADRVYWRRTADELWRELTVSLALPDKPDAVVLLDTSPCGIRRLTAVRVPRAPGSGRTTPIPSTTVLAAA